MRPGSARLLSVIAGLFGFGGVAAMGGIGTPTGAAVLPYTVCAAVCAAGAIAFRCAGPSGTTQPRARRPRRQLAEVYHLPLPSSPSEDANPTTTAPNPLF